MIDGITIYVSNLKVDGRKFLGVEKGIYYTDVNTYIGRWRNLRFIQSREGFKIEGSLNKFLNGNNVGEFGCLDVERALKKIEKTLEIDLHKGYIRKVEYGKTIELSSDVSQHIKRLGKYRNFRERDYHGELEPDTQKKGGIITGKLWDTKTGSQAFCVYDKVEELGKDVKRLGLEGKNLLKLEYRIKNSSGIKQVFKGKLDPHSLASQEIWDILDERFNKFYLEIQKNKVIEDIESITYEGDHYTHMITRDLGFLISLIYIPDWVERFISRERKSGRLSKLEIKRIRRDVKRIRSMFKIDDSIIQSLDYELKHQKGFISLSSLEGIIKLEEQYETSVNF